MLSREREELLNAMNKYGEAKIDANTATLMYRKGWFDCLVNERAMEVAVDSDDYIQINYANGTEFAHWQRDG